jgi:hypothetical protein
MLMSGKPTVTVPAKIEAAQLQFKNWRRVRERGQRIPENLWGTAVELAKRHGVGPTARALHLDYNQLKRRVGKGEGRENSGAFVELISPGAMLCRCSVEMEDGRGARMRIELQGGAPDVTALSRTFWSERE